MSFTKHDIENIIQKIQAKYVGKGRYVIIVVVAILIVILATLIF